MTTEKLNVPTPASAPLADGSTTGQKALAVTALVLGIASLLGAVFGWGGIVLGIAALVLGILAIKKSQPRGLSIAGIVTGSLGLIGGITMLIVAMLVITAVGVGIDALETGDLSQLEELGVEFELD